MFRLLLSGTTKMPLIPEPMNSRRLLAWLGIAIVACTSALWVWFRATEEAPALQSVRIESPEKRTNAFVAPPPHTANANKGVASHSDPSAGTAEYLLLGFAPYQFDADLEQMGFTTAEQKALAQQLFTRTFFILVGELAKSGEVSSSAGKALLTCELSDDVYEGIKERFFVEVRDIIGQPAYDKLLQSDRLYFINKQLLGFGEFPVMMQLTTEASPKGEPQIRFTFSTQLANRIGGTDSYFRSQRLPVEIINERFAAVREATKGSEFVWPK